MPEQVSPVDDSTTSTWKVRPLVLLLGAFCAGIAADRFLPQPEPAWWLTSLLAFAAWYAAWRTRRDNLAAALVLLLAAGVGATWHHVEWNLFGNDELSLGAQELDRPVVVEATVVSGPRIIAAPPVNPMRTIPVGDRTHFELAAGRIRDGVAWRRVSGSAVLIADGQVDAPRVGDTVRVFAMLSRPSPTQNPGQFDFATHERASRHLSLLRAGFPESVVVLRRADWWEPRRLLDEVRSSGKDLLRRYVSGRQSGLAAALLLGAREELDTERTEDFFATGAIHLLAISGLHVGILALAAWALRRLGLLSRRATLLAVVLLVVAYALLTESRPPVLRATMLIVAFCLARLLGRPAAPFNVLALAGFVVLAINPAQLFQAGTQLSFLAVATLLVAGPLLVSRPPVDPLDRLIARTRPWPVRTAKALVAGAVQLWLISTIVWLVVLPLVAHQFHLVALAALVLNPLLWIPIAVALFAGFGVMLFGWLLPPAGAFCGWICHWSLEAIGWTLHEAREIPGSHFWVAGPSGWWVLGFYALVAALVLLPPPRSRRLWCAALLACWTAVGLFTPGVGSSESPGGFASTRPLHCTFVSVGHGTSALLELPDGRTLLYDAGTLSSPHTGGQAVSGVLWSRGIHHLDAIVVSHADTDHYNAVPELLERFSVGVVYVSPVMFRDDSPALTALQEKIAAAGVPLEELSSLDRLATPGDYRLEVLHPLPGGVIGSDNANSIVLLVEYQGRRILLPGDLESPGMEDVQAEAPLDCDVVMAPHHGSLKSNPAGFAAWCTPEWVVISGGRSDNIAAVKAAYEEQDAQVLHTAEAGAVRVTVDERRLTVRAWRVDGW